jgi:molecular chaperone HtpG
MLLHGVIDSPDIPLNVSRSFLQADANVKKINTYITKKVADKLAELFRKDREGFQQKWNDIGLFVKYGMLSDEKFYDKAKDFGLLQNIDGQYFTLEEYKAYVQANQTDKNGNMVWLYSTDPEKQHAFVEAAQNRGYDVLKMDNMIDPHFIGMLEQKLEKTSLKRVDSDTVDKLIEKDEIKDTVLTEEERKTLQEIYEKAISNPSMQVSVDPLSPNDPPVVVTMPEFMRRMKDMQRTGGGGMMFMGNLPDSYNVSVNANHPISRHILKAREESKEKIAKQAFDLALLSQNMLTGSALTAFVKRSVELIEKE